MKRARMSGIEIRWSPRMTSCAGICVYEGRGGLCSVRLSLPLLKLRPRKDLVETLLHEMIHAYLFVTDNNKDHDGHGPEFHKHMNRINKETGTKISVYHSFHDEVNLYKQHWWRCSGTCQSKQPYFGYVKRSMNRAPSANDLWWADHQRSCGGSYTKVKEPEGYGQKKSKKTADVTKKTDTRTLPNEDKAPDIRLFWGSEKVGSISNGGKVGSISNSTKQPSATATSSASNNIPQQYNVNNLNKQTTSTGIRKVKGELSKNDDNISNEQPTFNWKPVLGNSRIPSSTGGVKVHTVWNNDGDKVKSKDKPAGSNISKGHGQVLGSQGQGMSFLAQLRREKGVPTKSGISEKSKRENVLSVSSNLIDNSRSETVDKRKDPFYSLQKSIAGGFEKNGQTSSSDIGTSSSNQGASLSNRGTPSSDRGTISGNRGTTFTNKRTSSDEMGASSSDRGASSSNRDAKPVINSKTNPTSGSDSILLDSDEDDFFTSRKPLFKKVNPASNFMSPPQKRISLYNKDSATQSMARDGSSKLDKAHSDNSKLVIGDGGLKRKQANGKLVSWTRKPQYSTSDDSDDEDLQLPVKKFKGDKRDKHDKHDKRDKRDKRDKGPLIKFKGIKTVNKKKKEGAENVEQSVSNRNINVAQDNVTAVVASDPLLQSCPVCQTKVASSQINAHLDQCLSFD